MMLNFLQEWIKSVVTVSVLISLALTVTPPGNVKRVAQLVSGLILAIVLIQPFTRGLPDFDWNPPELSGMENTDGSKLMKEIIEEKTAAYIVNKAQALGLSVEARVACEEGEGYPVPAYVAIVSDNPKEAERVLGPVIESELGIGATRQHYTTEIVKTGG